MEMKKFPRERMFELELCSMIRNMLGRWKRWETALEAADT